MKWALDVSGMGRGLCVIWLGRRGGGSVCLSGHRYRAACHRFVASVTFTMRFKLAWDANPKKISRLGVTNKAGSEKGY